MKRANKSILSDYDVLLEDTSIEKGFPKYGQLSKTGYIFQEKYEHQCYYKWTNKYLLNNICKDMKYVYGPINSLYLIWGEKNDMIFLCYSETNLSYAEIFPACTVSPSDSLDKTIRNEAYELLYNILLNNDILKYMYNLYIEDTQSDICFNDMKKEFKDTWQELKR